MVEKMFEDSCNDQQKEIANSVKRTVTTQTNFVNDRTTQIQSSHGRNTTSTDKQNAYPNSSSRGSLFIEIVEAMVIPLTTTLNITATLLKSFLNDKK